MIFYYISKKTFRFGRAAILLCAASVALTSCVASGPKVTRVKKAKPTEYFAESVLGVKASPRPVNVALASLPGSQMKRLPRGGGRDMVGKPYKIRGKWYYPREDLNYQANGTASWYGDAFHGRLTANGEIYDMNNLTAAHPTMPLPSYARVTNIKNGKSVIVRVNDRGPYASDRLVDLSKRAAQLLDYTHSGVAQVKLEYIGRAPVHGRDDEYLLASYQGNGANEGNPSVMVAQNGTAALQTPTLAGVAFAPILQEPPAVVNALQASTSSNDGDGVVLEEAVIRGALPSNPPVLVNRPSGCVTLEPCEGLASDGLLNGYAPIKLSAGKKSAFDVLGLDVLGVEGGQLQSARQGVASERVLLGSYSRAQINQLRAQLNKLAYLTFDAGIDADIEVYAQPVKGLSMDNLVRKLWSKGFDNAFVVR